MTTIQLDIPEDVAQVLGSFIKPKVEFVLEAIREIIARERHNELDRLLTEGYQATFEEDLALTKEFAAIDFETIDL
jgi:hypothetical protein